MRTKKFPTLNRRKLIKTLGSAAAVTPFFALVNCGGGGGSDNSDATSNSTSTTSNTTTSSNTTANTETTTETTTTSEWASGGTAAFTTVFPPSDPFASGLGNLCTVTSAYTLGPCYFSPDDFRDDISEGQLGVPMVLALKLVDADCNPIANANIEVWFCNREGLYSGDTSTSSDASRFNRAFCTDNDSEAVAARWFRGVQTTDSDGLVYFKGCFPGWYASRTTHIHFKITQGNIQTLVSQFCFDDDLCNDIYLNHVDYTGQAKDTSNTRDSVFNASTVDNYMFTVERQSDNSMLAYKAIQLS